MTIKHPFLPRDNASLHGKTYIYRYKPTRHSSTTIKLGTVDDSVRHLKREYIKARRLHLGDPSRFLNLAAKYLQYRWSQVLRGKLSESTYNRYASLLAKGKRLHQAFGQYSINEIHPGDVQDYLDGDYISGKEKPYVALNREISCFSTMCQWGKRKRYLTNNPCEGYSLNDEEPRSRYVTDEEFIKMFNVQRAGMGTAMMIILETGLRPADVIKLTYRENVTDNWLWVEESKTGKSVRFVIEEGSQLHKIIEQSKRRQPLGEFIVRKDNGKPFPSSNALGKEFRRRAVEASEKYNLTGREKLAMDWSLSDLRAKHATDRDEPGMASYALGHSSQSTTNRHYLRNSRGRLVVPLNSSLSKR